jgi:DNA-binding IclR family transcriptional regulator
MAAKTYNPVQSSHKFVDIIEYLFQQPGPVTGTQIAKALEAPHATVMSHLIVALERKWVRQVGELYEPGLRLMGMYSAYKMGLQTKLDELQRDLNTLEA